jgi:hypothetical protein
MKMGSIDNTAKGKLHDAAHRLYQSVLYFQNVIQYYMTLVNLISFTHIKSDLLPTDFHKTNKCSTTLCAHLLYYIQHQLDNKCVNAYIYSLTSLNKVGDLLY